MNPIIIELKKTSPKNVAVNLLYSHQNCRCFYCNKFMPFMTYNYERKKGYTVDHLFPRSRGYGKGGNTVLACRGCNEKKENRYPTTDELVRAWTLYNQMGRPFIATLIFP